MRRDLLLFVLATIVARYGASPVPKPTPDQLLYQSMEAGALISYNMATAAKTQGCGYPDVAPPEASVFNGNLPEKIDTDQWCEAVKSFGGKYATLVAKHLCGFTLWPSAARTGNFSYDYGTKIDIVRQLAESCASVGIKLGLYYSVNVNAYLNVANGQVQPGSPITQDQYVDIVLQQLTELWTGYGDLVEIWFDGGYGVPGLLEKLLALLSRTQPHAVIFNGCGLSSNAVMWIGTESGHAPYPVWNTDTGCPADGSAGNVSGITYIPKEVDLTLQNGDTWFFSEQAGYRSLDEMISIYHESVGHGGNMLLNLAPPHNSTLPDAAIRLYQQLGDFVRTCYGDGASPSSSALAYGRCDSCANMTLRRDGAPIRFDRVLLKEELADGQRVTDFQIVANDSVTIFNGSAIGRSLIVRFDSNITATSISIRVRATRDGVEGAALRLVSIPDPDACVARSEGGGGCDIRDGILIGGFALQSPFRTATVDACCDACSANQKCVGFTASPDTPAFTCTLLRATGGADRYIEGSFSGFPQR
eukprot:g2652.t1